MTISQHPSAPLIMVVGATGMQGGSVVNNLQASVKPYRMRGLTRDASKPNAQSLVKRGVEVVSCNIYVGNEAEVRKAFEVVSYVFVGALEHVRSLNVPINKTTTDCNQLLGACGQSTRNCRRKADGRRSFVLPTVLCCSGLSGISFHPDQR